MTRKSLENTLNPVNSKKARTPRTPNEFAVCRCLHLPGWQKLWVLRLASPLRDSFSGKLPVTRERDKAPSQTNREILQSS